MPGYLSHLAARVSGVKPAVRPRIPSIFESTPAAALPVAPDPVGLRIVEQETIAPQPAARPSAAPAFAEPPQLAPGQLRPAPPERHPAPIASRRIDSHEEVDALEPSARSAAPLRTPLEPRIETSVHDAPLSLHERVVARIEPRAADPLDRSILAEPQPLPRTPLSEPEIPRIARVEAETLPLRAEREEPHPDRRQPEPERIPLAAPQPPPGLPFAPQPEVRPIERFSAFEASQPQQPSVQVTIGRLIVEAVSSTPAAAPMPAARPHAPRLSLDDYLRQRRSQA